MSENEIRSTGTDDSPLPVVTMETDAGAVDLRFGYAAVGDPVYGDVPALGPWKPTEAGAEVYGAWIVSVGNWRSFTVQKRYFDGR